MLEAVLVAQLVAPIVLGVPVWIWGQTTSNRRDSSKRGRDRAGGGARLAPLVCAQCSAPVPLHDAPFACPSCGARVEPPADYVTTFEMRAAARRELAHAERRWRWSRWTSSLPAVVLLAAASLAWMGLVGDALLVVDWPMGLDLVVVMTALFLSGAGFAAAFGLRSASAKLPPLPELEFMTAPAAAADCTHCNAPVAFEADAFAAICPYCGADTYREALASSASHDAGVQEQRAGASLLAAVRELDERREMLFAIVGVSLVVEILYATVAVIGTVSDWINGPG
jgi:predicted RNA-binding Zn-ribbon protein involved in translation (DUF1610 family)|nr:hypothetical protein [Kofleriaceae bacterium]